jgi:integrase
MKKKVTTLAIKSMALGETIWDTEIRGYGVRWQTEASGRAFVFNYTNATGRRRQINIGTWGDEAWTEAKARKRAGELRVEVDTGRDPLAAKEADKAKAADNLGALIDLYLADETGAAGQRPRTLAETTRALRKHWAPFHAVPVASLERATIYRHLEQIKRTSGPAAAIRSHSCLSTCLVWGIKKGVAKIAANPAAMLTPAKPKAREKVLTLDELRRVWRATSALTPYDRVIRLLLLTGQRRSEISEMDWAELALDADGGPEFRLPKARAKNNRAHTVPLAPAALALLPSERKAKGLVFGTVSGFSRHKQDLDERSGTSGWVVHDLRRTAASMMAEHLKIAPHVIEAALNHQSGTKAGVAGIYNRATYAGEVKEALERWAEWVAALVGAKKVGCGHTATDSAESVGVAAG